MKMHEDEVDIDAELVGRLVAEQFPQLADLPISAFRSTGTVNAIYRKGGLHLDTPRRDFPPQDLKYAPIRREMLHRTSIRKLLRRDVPMARQTCARPTLAASDTASVEGSRIRSAQAHRNPSPPQDRSRFSHTPTPTNNSPLIGESRPSDGLLPRLDLSDLLLGEGNPRGAVRVR